MAKPNIGDLIPIGAVGDAQKADVLEGKTFSSEIEGVDITGTMPNNGARIITPSSANQNIQQGYHNGEGYVKGDPNFVASNLPVGMSLFGVSGASTAVKVYPGSQVYFGPVSAWTGGGPQGGGKQVGNISGKIKVEFNFWVGNSGTVQVKRNNSVVYEKTLNNPGGGTVTEYCSIDVTVAPNDQISVTFVSNNSNYNAGIDDLYFKTSQDLKTGAE